jgi:predicted aldo/keto reductase-like oxidoreductase
MLRKRRLGRTGLNLSLLGFGGIPIMRIPPEDAKGVIREAISLGIDFIDTARGYGDSEKKIGSALAGCRDEVILASKSPKRDRRGILEDVATSLSDLRTEMIDLYQLHCVNTSEDYARAMSDGGAYGALQEVKSEGRIRFTGITSHHLDILKRAIESDKFDTIQVLYSFIEDEAGREIIPMALERDIGVIAMKPLAGGSIQRYDIGLLYVLSTPGLIAIPGVASIEEVKRNVEIASDLRELSSTDLEVMRRIKGEVGKHFCRRCDYCQPCPNKIPISLLLHVESIRQRIGEEMMRSDFYGGVLEKAGRCDECGECEKRCPFGLHIIDLIKRARMILADVIG